MIADLVKQLRNHKSSSYMCQDCYGNVMDDAADEIERATKMLTQHLENIVGHLGASLRQQSSTDDKIIMGHIRDAYEAARKALIVAEGRDHHHAAGTMIGLDIDTCAICGQDIRADIHFKEKQAHTGRRWGE